MGRDLAVWIPTYDELLEIYWAVVALFDGTDRSFRGFAGVRDDGLLRSALTRPDTGIGDRDKYKSEREKAAALFHSLATNHGFNDGNKRTSLAVLLVVLYRGGWILTATDDELTDMVVSVGAGDEPFTGPADDIVEAITSWIREYTDRPDRIGDTSVKEFMEIVERAGGSYRSSGDGGSWIVMGSQPMKSVRISKATNQLSRGVVTSYLTRLELSEAFTGRPFGELLALDNEEQEQIMRYREVMQRLADFDASE